MGLRRALVSEPRYAPWQKPPYEDFEHRILILGGGFAGYNAARSLCELIWDRTDVGVMLLDRENLPDVLADGRGCDLQRRRAAQHRPAPHSVLR